jgi:hypothetical protein
MTLASSDRMDWIALYAYPERLAKLLPGESGVFICPPAWRGSLGRVCSKWVRENTSWSEDFPDGTPPTYVFWTCAAPHGLRVNRGHLPGPHRPQHVRYTYRPLPQA